MDFKNIAGDSHFVDRDTEDVMVRYGPVFTEYTILAEYNAVRDQTKTLQDMYVIPSANDPLNWFGVIFVRNGPYEGSIFRFHIFIPKTFPKSDLPTIAFTSTVFHPKVDPISGYMETRSAFGKWQCGVHHIWHLLLYIKRSLLVIDERNAVNLLAADLYVSNPAAFRAKVAECIDESKRRLHDDSPFSNDPHYLRFSSYNPNIHGTFRKAILAEKSNSNASSKPLSWIKPGSLEPCSAFN